MIKSYESARAIGQDRANRMHNVMYLYHLDEGYYLSSIFERPFVFEQFYDRIKKIEDIYPQEEQGSEAT